MYDEYAFQTNDQLFAAYAQMPNGQGWWYKKWETETCLTVLKIDTDDILALNSDLSQFHVVGLAQRGHANDFAKHLEHTYFPPLTEQNHEFHWRLFKWMDLDWVIASVPIGKANCAYLAASATGCRLANGVPHVFGMAQGGRGIGNTRHTVGTKLPMGFTGISEEVFPLNNDRTFTLEPDHGHRGPTIGAIGQFQPAPAPKEPDLLDLIRARRRKSK